jgi:hypothetical protein
MEKNSVLKSPVEYRSYDGVVPFFSRLDWQIAPRLS